MERQRYTERSGLGLFVPRALGWPITEATMAPWYRFQASFLDTDKGNGYLCRARRVG